jgi:hypothetical protein
MHSSFKRAVYLGLALSMVPLASAQEGHPVKGSWIGEWEGNTASGESLLMVMNWDGQNITGMINPGTDNIQISSATLNPDDWSIRIEGGGYVLQGSFERLELPNRSISGTWQNGGANGDFEIVRQ